MEGTQWSAPAGLLSMVDGTAPSARTLYVPLATAVAALWWPSHSAAPGASTVQRDPKFSPNACSHPISTRVFVAVVLQRAC